MSTAVNWLYTFQSIPGRPAGAGPEKNVWASQVLMRFKILNGLGHINKT